jgi:hypothetical protein
VKLLIAVVSCYKYMSRAYVQRATWVRDAAAVGVDVRFFVGQLEQSEPPSDGPYVGPDMVQLNVPDDYQNVRRKVQAMLIWATREGYDFILKTDDDCIVMPKNWVDSLDSKYNYVGRVRGPSGQYVDPDPNGITRNLATGWKLYGSKEVSFCSGYGYTLTGDAALEVAYAPDNGDWAEDRFTGQVLRRAGIVPKHNDQYLLWPLLSTSTDPKIATWRMGLQKNPIVVCPYARPNVVDDIYYAWKDNGYIPAK